MMNPIQSREQLLERLQSLLPNKQQQELQALSDEQLQEFSEMLHGLTTDGAERRTETRRGMMCRVEILSADANKPFGTVRGLQEDQSASGARIIIARHIPVGTRVTVRRNGIENTGTVRQCSRDKFGHAIGIRFDRAQ
jgi:hypothetical protein